MSVTSEAPRKGRSNAILTYETVEEIKLGIQKVDMKVAHVADKLDDVSRAHVDHEVRIRALELTAAGTAASGGTAKFLYGAIWPVAATIISALNFWAK